MALELKCVCCGLAGRIRELAGIDEAGKHLTFGPSCDLCVGLVWWAHFESTTAATPDERALTRWDLRKQRAKVRGVVFREEPPRSEIERATEEDIAAAVSP